MSADDGLPSNMIATLRIDLLGSDPPIWREIEVPTSMTLKQLMRSFRPPWDGRTEVAPFQWTISRLAGYVVVMVACMSAS